MIWEIGCVVIFEKPVEKLIFFRLIKNAPAPSDIRPVARLHEVVLEAGLTGDDYHAMIKNAELIAKRSLTYD